MPPIVPFTGSEMEPGEHHQSTTTKNMSPSFKFRITLISAFLLFAHLSIGQSLLAPVRVADLNPNGASSPSNLTVGGTNKDHLFYVCDNGVPGGSARRVWIYDLAASTGIQTMLREGPESMRILSSAGDRFFYSYSSSGYSSQAEVKWHGINGTVAGNIFAGQFRAPIIGVTIGTNLITSGNFPQGSPSAGIEPCAIDPIARTSTLLRNIAPGSTSSEITGFTLHNNKAYFAATNTASGRELYTTDGTPAGTLMLKDIIAGATGSEPADMRSAGGRLYFSALSVIGNREPWTCNGTTAGTVKLKEINPSTTVGSDPKEFTAMGTKVFFSANDGTNGRELWVTDGTANGTVMVKDIITGSSGSNPHDLVVFNKKLWFVASDALGRMRSLYATDGTSGGTVKMLSLPANSDGEHLNVCNGKLFYVSRDATSSKMWCTDGTAKGTKQVQPAISPNINPIGTGPMVVMGNWLYFNGNFDGTGAELWKVQ